MIVRLTLLSLLAGVVWGIVAYALGRVAFGPSIWPGVLACPLVGVVVGRLTHEAFARGGFVSRSLWSLASLYLGALLFALPIGAWQWFGRGGEASLELVFEPFLAVVWGVTMTGYFLALWPLAYFTHWFIDWRMDAW